MRYRVTCWHDATFTKHDTGERHYRSSAFLLAYYMAYDRLESFAKLDTQSAWNVRTEIERANDIMHPGEQRSFPISNTGYTITVSAVAS